MSLSPLRLRLVMIPVTATQFMEILDGTIITTAFLLRGADLALCADLQQSTSTAVTVVVLCVGGMARSMQFTTLSTLAFADMPKVAISDARGLFSMVAQLSNAAGITLGAPCYAWRGRWRERLGCAGRGWTTSARFCWWR